MPHRSTLYGILDDQVAVLHKVGQALNRLSEPHELLRLIHGSLGRVLNNANFYIALYDEAKQFITFPVYTIDGQIVTRPSRPFSNGITEYVIRHREPLRIPDRMLHRLEELGIDQLGRPARSLIAVPLQVGANILGVMAVQDYQNENTFSASHQELLATFAAQAAIALENARLYNAVQTELANRRYVEEALRRSQASLELAQTQARLGNWEFDPVTQEKYWSAELYRLFDRDPSLGPPKFPEFLEMLHPEDRELLRETQTRTMSSVHPLTIDFRSNPDHGPLRYFSGTSYRVREPYATSNRLAGVILDMTDRRHAEFALQEHAQRLREAQAIAHVGSFHWDIVANKVVWSDEMYRIHGYQPQEIEPTYDGYMARVHPDHLSQVKAAVEYAKRTREPFEHQYRIVWRNGEERWIFSRGRAVVNPAGVTIALEGICQDITEQRRLEEQFHHAQRLAAIGQMAGGVAHNFNNIMTVISGYATLLQAELPPDHQHVRFANEIARAADRAATLTRQILAFSRKQMLQPKVLNLNRVVASVQEMLRRLVTENVQVVPELDPKLWSARLDEGRIEEVLLNLSVNARDAMPKGGRLRIASANLQLDGPKDTFYGVMPPGRYVSLRVTDTGCGMDDRVKEHLFEPFFTTKEVGKGTGLGLASVSGIVQQSDGFIEVDSAVGQGTTITLHFPAVDEEIPTAIPAPTPAAPVSGTETLLVVEDDDGVRTMIRLVLAERGYQVLEARHGAEALQVARDHVGEISLVLTDIIMPQLNGPDFVAQLRIDRPGIKVIYVSGHSGTDIRSRDPADADLIAKPFSPAVLVERIRKLLG